MAAYQPWVVLLLFLPAFWACVGGVDFEFDSFADLSSLSLFGSYTITDEGAIMMPNSTDNPGPSRAVLKDQIQLYNRSTGEALSFTTSFIFTIVPTSAGNAHGDGMAFIIAPTAPPNGSGGGSLGIFDPRPYGYAGNPALRTVAVEFDTLKNEWDMNDNHVGLDISSAVSSNATNLTAHGINLVADAVESQELEAWIEYDAVAKELNVWIAKSPVGDKALGILVLQQTDFDLSNFVPEMAYIGFSAATGGVSEYHIIHEWQFSTGLGAFPHSESPASQPLPPSVASQVPSSPADANDHPPVSPPGVEGSSGGTKHSSTKTIIIACSVGTPVLGLLVAAIKFWKELKVCCCGGSNKQAGGVPLTVTGPLTVTVTVTATR